MQCGHVSLLKWEVGNLRIGNCVYKSQVRLPFFGRAWVGDVLDEVVVVFVSCGVEVAGGVGS